MLGFLALWCSIVHPCVRIFSFLTLFKKKIFTNMPLVVLSKKIDPYLGAVVQGHFLGVADMATCVGRTCHELDAVDLGAKLGTNYCGTELWKLTNLIFFHDLDIEKSRVFTVTCCLIT
jgi:hypothetical protein